MLYQVMNKRWTEFQLLLIAVLQLQSENRCEGTQQLSHQKKNIERSHFHSEMKGSRRRAWLQRACGPPQAQSLSHHCGYLCRTADACAQSLQGNHICPHTFMYGLSSAQAAWLQEVDMAGPHTAEGIPVEASSERPPSQYHMCSRAAADCGYWLRG